MDRNNNILKFNSLDKFPVDFQKRLNNIIQNLKKFQNSSDIDSIKNTSIQFYELLLEMFNFSWENYRLISDISYLCSDYVSKLYLYTPVNVEHIMVELSDSFIHELDIPLNLSYISAPELIQKTIKYINNILHEIRNEKRLTSLI